MLCTLLAPSHRSPARAPACLWPGHSALALTLLSSACALVPSVPAGPIAGSGRFGGSWAYAHAPARVETGEVRFHAGGAQYGGPLHASRPLPWGIELEVRTGATSTFRSDVVRGQRIARVRAELYPPLPFGHAASGLPNAFGVLTLGIGGGRQLLALLPVPQDYQDSGEEGPIQSSLNVLRNEARLESSVGLHWLVKGGAFTLVTQPWVALSQGAPRASECDGCYLDLVALDSGWGVSVALSAQVVWGEP